ncbi:MAG: fumarylacetoacetate hydrolase family protein [Chloroflexi bacterium]|nr:fumarylacetoacetate hydrolase family protein [Chloroflexota bacterium]
MFGYTVANDVSARDIQTRIDSQWTRGRASIPSARSARAL